MYIVLCLWQIEDAISIAVAVIIVGTVAFVQEYRSEKTLEALTSLVPHTCNAVRDGLLSNISADELVPGDIIKLHAGDRVPADARVVICNGLLCDESTMTGETHPREKTSFAKVDGADEEGNIAENSNLVYMGTLVCAGNAMAVVTHTGLLTEFGKTFQDTKDVEKGRTPLQVRCIGKFNVLM
jgi:Ca2+-transporting ATPase